MVEFKGRLTEHFSLSDYIINQTEKCEITKEAMLHATMLEEFRKWLGRPMTVNAWYRTKKYNASVGGVQTSSHLKGTATDWHTNITIDEAKFKKYAKKWRDICKKHGVVGEAGLYTWGVHFGSQITYSKTFYHWDSRRGKQINMPFRELR